MTNGIINVCLKFIKFAMETLDCGNKGVGFAVFVKAIAICSGGGVSCDRNQHCALRRRIRWESCIGILKQPKDSVSDVKRESQDFVDFVVERISGDQRHTAVFITY